MSCLPFVAGALLSASSPAESGPTPATVAALPAIALGDVGARVPFVEYESENAVSNGVMLGPTRRSGKLSTEASGRRAVRLDLPSQSIGWVLARAANAITVRYALPDDREGRGLNSQLELFVDGAAIATLPVTSRFGWYYGKYPFTNNPGDGSPHHFWDEARVHLPRTIGPGSCLVIRRAADKRISWVAVDLIDAELVTKSRQAPLGALNITSFGADPSGRRSARKSFIRAIKSAQRNKRPLYIPPGKYRVDGHIQVDQVSLFGAGPWHSKVFGHGLGFYGRRSPASSSRVLLDGFAIESDVTERKDHLSLSAIGGSFRDSTFNNLFLQHAKVGVWIDGPASNLTLRKLRITDHSADGINVHRDVTNVVIEDNFIRNSGDDGIASWSENIPNVGVVIRRNTVIAPLLANGIAIYGGRNISIDRNLVADTITQGGGIHLGARFKAAPFTGAINLDHNTLVRAGSFDPNWQSGVGALWLYSLEEPISVASIRMRSTRIIDSSCQAVHLTGDYSIAGVAIDGLEVLRPGGSILTTQTSGTAALRNVTSIPAYPVTAVEITSDFNLLDRGGNIGWRSASVDRVSAPSCGAVEAPGPVGAGGAAAYAEPPPHASVTGS